MHLIIYNSHPSDPIRLLIATYIVPGWWFGTSILFSHILGMSSSQLTFIFFRGVQTTNQVLTSQYNPFFSYFFPVNPSIPWSSPPFFVAICPSPSHRSSAAGDAQGHGTRRRIQETRNGWFHPRKGGISPFKMWFKDPKFEDVQHQI